MNEILFTIGDWPVHTGAALICFGALALTLLAGAGLVIHSFWKLTQVDLGFRRDHILTFNLPVNFDRFARPEQVTAFYRPLIEKVSALPGVESATASSGTPLAWRGWGMPFSLAGQPVDDPSKLPGTRLTLVTQDYFRTFGISILRGRGFTATDVEGSQPVAMVNEAFVKKFLSNVDPLKQRIVIRQLGLATMGPPIEPSIVGICRAVRNRGMRDESAAELSVPLWQEPMQDVSVSVRTHGDPSSVANSVSAVVGSADADLAMDNVRTMDQVVDECGDENRLAGAGQTGDAQAHGRREEPGGTARQRVERNPRLVGESGQR